MVSGIRIEMEIFNFSKSNRESEIKKKTSLNSSPEKGNSSLNTDSDKNSTNISSQEQMTIDSLLAGLEISKSWTFKRIDDFPANSRKRSETSIQENVPEEKAVTFSHMLKQDNGFKKFQEWNNIISQEVLVELSPKKCPFKGPPCTLPRQNFKRSSERGLVSAVDMIQAELQILTSLAPWTSNIASTLLERIRHYQECTAHHEKISLSEVVTHIQGLNLYIANKRKKNLEVREGKKKVSKERSKENSVVNQVKKLPSFGSEGSPCAQTVLELDSKKEKRRSFDKGGQDVNSFTSQVNEFSGTSVVPSRDKPEDTLSVKSYSKAVVRGVWGGIARSILVLEPSTQIFTFVRKTFLKRQTISYLKLVELCEENFLRFPENFFVVYFPKPNNGEVLNSNESSKFFNPFEEVLKAVYQKMEFKYLEEEVAGLRNLITKIQKNQIKLSKVLLRESVFSQSLVRLTNPNFLEEESKALKKVSETEDPSQQCTLEDLQEVLHKVKEKCSFKNRLIETVTKGLLHKIPKEWWEEVVGCTFEGMNNQTEYQKIENFLQQCSSYFSKKEKATKQTSLSENQGEEEELNMNATEGSCAEEISCSLSNCDEKPSEKRVDVSFSELDMYLNTEPTTTSGENSPEKFKIKRLEHQISFLSVENSKLWQEVNALKDSLENSIKDTLSGKIVSVSSNPPSMSTLGKKINVTVHISSDKLSRRSKESEYLNFRKKPGDTCEDGYSRTSKCSLHGNSSTTEYNRSSEEKDQTSNGLETKQNLNLKSSLRTQSDLNNLDDFTSNTPEKAQGYLIPKDKIIGRVSTPAVQLALSENPEYHLLKAADVLDTQKAGPSQKGIEIDYILQRPSLGRVCGNQNQTLGMHAILSNERGLQPIMENDQSAFTSSFCSSGSLCQAVQQLRARVRSIHKEVTVLKTKNDRVDKLLDKLLDEAVVNSKSFEEIEHNLKRMNRLD